MEGPSHPGIDGMAAVPAAPSPTGRDLEGNGKIKQKDKDKSFAQTWQESATPETQDPIGRVVAML